MELIIVTGLSGAGKSQAVHCLEDIGYYCVDNMPPRLMMDFIRLAEDKGEFEKVAFVMDIRGGQFFYDLADGISELDSSGINYKMIFRGKEEHHEEAAPVKPAPAAGEEAAK